jgi:O-antigen/teichoic acid export membrane protein
MSAGSVESRAAKATFAAALSMGLSVALQLLSVPICLRYWGEQTYGLWLALIALANLCRTFDYGFTAYVGNELNILYHGDERELRERLASAIWGAIALGALELLAAALIVFAGALPGLLGIPAEIARSGSAGAVLAILLIGLVTTGPYLGIVHKLLVPAGMLHQATWWFMALQIAQSAALVLSALFELTLPQAAALYATTQVAIQVASAGYVAVKLPRFFPWWRAPSWAVGSRDLLRSTLMVGATLLTQVGTNGVVMLVSGGLGAAAVPAFTTVRTLAGLWTTLVNVVSTPLLPDVVRYHARKDASKLVASLEAHWWISNGLVNLSVLLSLPFLDALYRAWTRGHVALDTPLLALFLLSVVVGTPGGLIVVYLVGINHLRAVSAVFAARGLVPIAVGMALLPELGVAGVGVGIALGELLGPVLVGGLYVRGLLAGMEGAPAPIWQPSALGTVCAAGYLVLYAAGAVSFGVAYAAAIAGVAVSVAWGWRAIRPEVRERVLNLARSRLPGFLRAR